jgi:hypothetical protein
MSKGIGPFWHEKYMLLNILVVIGIALLFAIVVPNTIHRFPGHNILIWTIGILIILIIIGLRLWLVWFFEIRKKS